MQILRRKLGDFDKVFINIDISSYGKTAGDIEDIKFQIKKQTDSVDTVIFVKKYSLGQITYTDANGIISCQVEWNYNEYSAFEAGLQYIGGCFIKFAGDPAFDENQTQQSSFTVYIDQDFSRE